MCVGVRLDALEQQGRQVTERDRAPVAQDLVRAAARCLRVGGLAGQGGAVVHARVGAGGGDAVAEEVALQGAQPDRAGDVPGAVRAVDGDQGVGEDLVAAGAAGALRGLGVAALEPLAAGAGDGGAQAGVLGRAGQDRRGEAEELTVGVVQAEGALRREAAGEARVRGRSPR